MDQEKVSLHYFDVPQLLQDTFPCTDFSSIVELVNYNLPIQIYESLTIANLSY